MLTTVVPLASVTIVPLCAVEKLEDDWMEELLRVAVLFVPCKSEEPDVPLVLNKTEEPEPVTEAWMEELS